MEEESDIEDHTASDRSEEESGEDLGNYDPDDSDSEDVNNFLDMEAAESENEYDELNDTSTAAEPFYFPQFRSLPPELRAHVWEFFDLDLREKARVFRMFVMTSPVQFWRSAGLIEQTAPARAMLATHRESRALALKFYPDTLDIHLGSGVIRYNSERDIVLLSISSILRPAHLEDLFSSLGSTKNIAFDGLREANKAILYPRLAAHPTLKAVFHCHGSHEYPNDELRWCASDLVQRFCIEQTEHDPTLGPQTLRSMFCWPDLENHRKFAEEHAAEEHVQTLAENSNPLTIWTMVEFAFDEELRLYQSLKSGRLLPSDWDTDVPFDSSDDDEYESEGIDDATIESNSASDEEEDDDDLVVQSNSDEDDSSVFNGFSPIQDDNIHLYLDGEMEGGKFSSLEPESPRRHHDASEHGLSDEEPVQKTARRKRRIVSSDDEDESANENDEEVRISSQSAKRSRVILSDTEDEDGDKSEKSSRPAKRSRVFLSDTEEEDDGHTDEDAEKNRNSVRESESEESGESEDEEPVKTKPMSLFEKLNQFRQENPIPSNLDTGSDVEASMGSEGWDGNDYAGFPDDEVEDEDGLLGNGSQVAEMPEEHLDEDEDDEGW
ncbi:uncharacterized protein F4812DRAFT_440583 [Daldinia caldariorum]|uniref:uncharacterized protein n=1 Tax=Daldinia caldariorum TaxID=326644 RepID=UPI0020084434|nr:uncharacterized protein F4812DRAFT_440583 [Daldinia caldariorum]KAI1464833.1 hypothetical protein F4812DRAFT_440583 [Daldinia caldariorum]